MPGKSTRTARYLTSTNPRHGYAGELYVPPGALSGRNESTRLTVGISPEKTQYDSNEVGQNLGLRDDINVVCDSSLFHDRMPKALWDGITNTPGKLIVTPLVQKELLPWIQRRTDKFFSNLLDMQSTPAQLLDFKDWIPCEARTYVHYISLLHARSHATYYAEHLLAQNLGRPLTPASVETVRAWIQSNLGERGYAFAKKGDKEAENPDRVPYTDEEVVYTAFALALKTGKDTIILTRDEDLLDQFYRFTYLLDSHYRSYLIATRYANDPTAFHAERLPESDLADQFFDGAVDFIHRTNDLPNDVLPKSFTPVSVQCDLVGDLHTGISFLAEREILALLLTKGATNGANTRMLAGKNCHLLYPGLPGMPDATQGFLIGQDRAAQLPSTGQLVPLLEFTQAIHLVERHSDVLEAEADS
jgi:hypothetical protein